MENELEKNPWFVKESITKYDNPWIKVVEHQVISPANKDGIYGVVEFKNKAVAIVPLDEHNNTWLVGQFRFPMNTYEWEVPEGGSPADETPLETAQRELAEEVGLVAEEYELVQEVQLSNCTTNEIGFIFVARRLKEVAQKFDETEVLQIKKLPFAEVYEMATAGKIKDNFSLTAIYRVKLLLDQGAL